MKETLQWYLWFRFLLGNLLNWLSAFQITMKLHCYVFMKCIWWSYKYSATLILWFFTFQCWKNSRAYNVDIFNQDHVKFIETISTKKAKCGHFWGSQGSMRWSLQAMKMSKACRKKYVPQILWNDYPLQRLLKEKSLTEFELLGSDCSI